MKAIRATRERLWPDNMKNYRDQAAERINRAGETLDTLIYKPPEDLKDAILIVARARIELVNANRFLERAGAPTLPNEL